MHNICATYNYFIHSIVSFDSAFSLKDVPLHANYISKFLFRTFKENTDGTFWQTASLTISAKLQVTWTPAILFSATLIFTMTSTSKWLSSTKDVTRHASMLHQCKIRDDGLRFAFVIQL